MVAKVLNLDKCLRKFGDLQGINLAPFFEQATLRIHRTAKDLCPVDTGRLYESIQREGLANGDYATGGRVFTSVEYAAHQEFGTTTMTAANGDRGYMRPAVDINKDSIERSFESYVRKQINVIARK